MAKGPDKLTRNYRDELDALMSDVSRDYPYFIGFPGSVDFNYSEVLPFFKYLLNNVGDPYVDPLHTNHSKKLEREVVDFFADLFHAPKSDRWGYVTNGGTEGNLYALYIARALFPDAPVVYSDSAHYSIAKNIGILGMRSIVVRSDETGEMDYADLRRRLARSRAKQAIIVATIGTTMTEAKDNVQIIRYILNELGLDDASFIHCDAALAGVYSAFAIPHHPFDFADGADSISISGHKFIGCPMPSGVVITRKAYRNKVVRSAYYTGSPDSTISGSRNGHAPIMLWCAIAKLGADGLRDRAINSMELARYLHTRLRCIGWPSWKNEAAFTVVIRQPPKHIIRKWQLATYNGKSHVICMPGVTKLMIDRFLDDIILVSGDKSSNTKVARKARNDKK